eukprot:TRINITY_DN41269_c0_g1_i1.p1 TRINITY_DN41269_c0_g1~~TRINITY_DN41269_c0_g1_i1.p1  ORF type:complete len:795 (+),score=212.72 TRINITY_DN41269_c0_g1_i1:60-2387(+)
MSAAEGEKLLKEAETDQLHNKTDDAIVGSEAASKIFRELGDDKKLAEALRILIACKMRKADGARPVESLQIVGDELEKFRAKGSRIGEACMMLSLAEINTDRRGTRKREESLQMGLEALEIFRELDEKKFMVASLQHLSNVHIKFCDKGCAGKSGKEATKFAQQALALARQLKEPRDRLYEASALHNVGVGKWYSEAPFKDGLKPAKEALQIFKEMGLKRFQAAQLHSIADWHQRRGIGKQGIPYAQEAMEIFQQIDGSKGWESAALCTLVSALMDKDDTETALKTAQAGLEKFREKGDKTAEAQALDLMAGIYLAQDDKDEALKLSEESLSIFREVGDKRAESYVLHTVSQVQSKSDNPDEAVKSVKESLVLAGELGDTREQAKCLAQLSRLHLLSREYQQSIEFAEEAQVVFQKSGDVCGEGVTLLNKASAHLGLGDVELALQTAEDALAMFVQLEDMRQEATAHHFLYEIHTQAGNYEAALREVITARNLYHKLGDQREEASMLLRVSNGHISVLNHNKNLGRRETKKACDGALKAAKEAVAICKKFDREKAFQANAYSVLAQCQGMVGKMKEGLKSANESLRISEEEGNRKGIAAALVTIGEIYSMNGKKEEAKKFAYKSLDLAQKIRDPQSEHAATQLIEHLEGKGGKQQEDFAGSYDTPSLDAGAAAASSQGESALGPYSGPTVESLSGKIQELASALVSVDDLELDSPLMEAGLDSLSMVQFRNTLQQQFPGVPMPASLIFDNPSVRAVAANIVDELKSAHEAGRPLM